MPRPPPPSTLFPYTTLFRSALERRRVPPAASTGLRFDECPHGQDRKSTRLNSSHRCISYAVFCLKKKKKLHSAIVLIDNKIHLTSLTLSKNHQIRKDARYWR